MPGAKSLIEKSKAKDAGRIVLPTKAVAEIKLVVQHNDSVPWGQKVTRQDVVKMLASEFGVRMTPATFSRWCQTHLERTFG